MQGTGTGGLRSAAAFASMIAAVAPSAALACGEPSDQWYFDVSEVVVEGEAQCDRSAQFCSVEITSIRKGDQYLKGQSEPLILNFTNDIIIDNSIDEDGTQRIIYTCGGRLFEPDMNRFFGLFFIDADVKTGELFARRHRIRLEDGQWRRPSDCEMIEGEIKCFED